MQRSLFFFFFFLTLLRFLIDFRFALLPDNPDFRTSSVPYFHIFTSPLQPVFDLEDAVEWKVF